MSKMFLVIDHPFNRHHYSDIIGQKFAVAPSYARSKEIESTEEVVISDEDHEILCGLRPPILVDPTGVGPTIEV